MGKDDKPHGWWAGQNDDEEAIRRMHEATKPPGNPPHGRERSDRSCALVLVAGAGGVTALVWALAEAASRIV